MCLGILFLLFFHLAIAYFVGSIVAFSKGNEFGMWVGIGYALLFPFLFMLGWNAGESIKG